MTRIAILAAALIAALAAWPEAASAQHFSFGISTGRHHHHGWHHHHHCWDDWCGPRFSYAYVYPPPVRERVIYVQPQTTEVWETRVAPPAASTVPRLSAVQSRLTIRNSAGHETPVNFLIDRKEASLADGETRTWSGTARRSVQFDRGGSYGTAQYDLTGGDYEFVVTARGWDLVKQDAEPARTATDPTPRKNSLPATTLR